PTAPYTPAGAPSLPHGSRSPALLLPPPGRRPAASPRPAPRAPPPPPLSPLPPPSTPPRSLLARSGNLGSSPAGPASRRRPDSRPPASSPRLPSYTDGPRAPDSVRQARTSPPSDPPSPHTRGTLRPLRCITPPPLPLAPALHPHPSRRAACWR